MRVPDGKDGGAAAVLAALGGIDGLLGKSVPTERGDAWDLSLSSKRDVRAEVSRAVVGAGLDLLRLDARAVDLENTFLRLVAASPAAAPAPAPKE